MRIAFLALHFAEYSAHLAAALAEENDVLLVLYGDNARNELGLRLDTEFNRTHLKVRLIEPPKGIADVLRNTLEIVGSVREFCPDVVHMQEGLRDELVFSLLAFFQFPLFLTIHDPSNHSGTDAKRMRFSRYRFYRAVLRRVADRAFVHGDALEVELTQQLPRFIGRTCSVPHGPLGPSLLEVGSSPPQDDARFLFFGRLHEYKGLRYFVEAIQILHREGMQVRGVIAGRGSDLANNMPQIEQTPSAFEVVDRYVTEEEVRQLFSETTAAVLPYVDGTQSGVAALALGYGRPVIATRVGSIPELVRNDVNGILVTPRSVEELAAAMRTLATDRVRWTKLANGAVALRSGELSWQRIAATTTAAYRDVLKG